MAETILFALGALLLLIAVIIAAIALFIRYAVRRVVEDDYPIVGDGAWFSIGEPTAPRIPRGGA